MVIGNFSPIELRTDKGALWENFREFIINSDNWVDLIKTIKFTQDGNDKEKAQCRLQGPGSH